MPGKLADKVILITGASRGLGEAMAVAYAAEGATVILTGRTLSDLDRVAALCREAGSPAADSVLLDVRDEAQTERAMRYAVDTYGRLDVLVVNAAVGPAVSGRRLGDLTTYDLATWNAIMDTNFTGAFLTLKAGFAVMEPGSAIIVIGSGTGRGGSSGNAVYGASKAGVDALAIMAAKYGEKVGVRVNCLDPGGMVDTYLFGPNKMPEFLKRISHLQPDVMVPAAVWLASDESRDVTGGFITATDFNANLADPRAAVRPKP